MASKYEILATVLDSQADRFGDEMGWHLVVTGVLEELHDSERRGGTDIEELAEAIYERIAASANVTPFEERLKPGEINPETGLYRVE